MQLQRRGDERRRRQPVARGMPIMPRYLSAINAIMHLIRDIPPPSRRL
jgi:hypothetical protein